MTSRSTVRTVLVTAVVTVGLAGCGAASGAPGPAAGEGPDRPAAGGEGLVVDELALEAPVLLDPVAEGLRLTELTYDPPSAGSEPTRATLYGDPDLADTLDGPVLLVGTSSGSASLAGPPPDATGKDVDLGGRTGRVVRAGDRTWVVIESNDHRGFVVGRGIDEEELVAAARGADLASATATVAPDAVPAGLEPLVAGSPPDRPGAGSGESMLLQGSSSYVSVFAVGADPRLAALWGFWIEDASGTEVRGRPGSAGAAGGANVGDPDARGRVWAEDGMVLAALATMNGDGDRNAGPDELLDQVVDDLRVGTWAEFEELDGEIRIRPPTRDEAGCGPEGGFVSGVEGDVRWSFQLRVGVSDWSTCYLDLTAGGGGGGTIVPPPVGELTISGREGIVGGVAPPGTARVTLTAADGRTVEAQLADVGPRPGERVWGAYLTPGQAAPPGPPPSTATAYDAAGAVLDSAAG